MHPSILGRQVFRQRRTRLIDVKRQSEISEVRKMKNSIRIKQHHQQSVIRNFQKRFKNLLAVIITLTTLNTILIPEASAQQGNPSGGALQRSQGLRLNDMVRTPMEISPWYKVPD